MRIHASPGRSAALYAGFSFVWILLFDLVIETRMPADGARMVLDIAWGIIYVILTSILLYLLVHRVTGKVERERAWYEALFAASPDAIFILGRDGRISGANHIALERYGYGPGELRALQLGDLAPPGARAIHDERLAAAVAGSGRFESRHMTAGGRRIAVDVAVRPVLRGDEPCLLCTVRDISGLQNALETLRQSEEMQRALVACSPVALFSLGLDGRVLSWNPTAETLTGWAEAEAVGQPLPIVPPGADGEFAALRRRVMSGESLAGVHVVRRRRDGSSFTGSLSVAPVRGADGGIMGMMCAMEDVTDRLQADAALAESERRFRLAVEEAPFPILIHASDGEIMASSRAVGALTGHDADSLATMADWVRAAGADDGAAMAEVFALAHHSAGRSEAGEHAVRCRDRGVRQWEISSTRLGRLPDGRTVVISMAADVTDRKAAEHEREVIREQLYHAQRIEAVGELAGGVAHDFNNILQAMTGYARLLLDHVPADGLLREGLEEIHRGTERATSLTRQLLAFSRRQVMQLEILDLCRVAADMLRMVRRLIPEAIDIRFEPCAGQATVRADRAMVEQVLLNLCLNARDAMPDGGVLSVSVGEATVGPELLATHAWAMPGDHILMTVADTGCGMDPAVLERAFEPFFTTKSRAGGTGLGLATVYGIVKQHDGLVVAASEPGRGAEFRVYLPRVEADVDEERVVAIPAPATGPGGDETILLVEDDPGARRLATRILELAGYTVLTAADGEEAVDLFGAHASDVALAILDVVMPGLNGPDTLQHLTALRPGLPALFVTGYARDGVHKGLVLDEGLALLRKPYAPEALLAAVRERIDKSDFAAF